MTDEGAQARRPEGDDATQPSPATPAPSEAGASAGPASVAGEETTADVRPDEPTAEVRPDEPTADVRPDEPTAEVPAGGRWAADPTLRDAPVEGGSATEEP